MFMEKKYLWSISICTLLLIGAGIQFTTNAETSSSSNTVSCTQEYSPVCWQPKSPTCIGTSEAFCLQNAPAPKTYSNTCMLNAAGATFLYKWECKGTTTSCPQYSVPDLKSNCSIEWITDTKGCKKPKITCDDTSKTACTQEYSPVCGETKNVCCGSWTGTALPTYCQNVKVSCDAVQKTFSNKCMLEAAGAKYVSDGECKKTTNTCPVVEPIANPPSGCQIEWTTDNNGCKKPKLSCNNTGTGTTDSITKKVNEVMTSFFKKVDALSSNEEKLNTLNSVYNTLKQKSGKVSTTTQKILDYMLSRIQEKITKINAEGNSEINDLLKILQ